MQTNRWQDFKDKGHLFTLNSRWPLLKFVEYIPSWNILFIYLDKSVLLHRRCLMSKFSEILTLLCRKIFSFFNRFFTKLFPVAVVLLLYKNLNFLRIWSAHVVLCYRKHFYSVLTNLSNLSHSKSSTVPFPKFRSDLKNFLIKHFPTMQAFANVLQNRSSYKFHDIRKKISVLESLFDKVTRLMAFNFIKNRPLQRCFPVNITKCLRKAFFIEHLRWLLLKIVE